MIDIFAKVNDWMNKSYIDSAGNWCKTYLGHFNTILPYIVGIMIILFIVTVIFLIKTGKYKKFFKWLSSHIGICSTVIFGLGILLYAIGFYKPQLGALAIVPRAIISSFRMFVVANELARVDSDLQKDAIYMLFFALIHFSAALITFMFIFKMVGYKIQSALKVQQNYYNKEKTGTVHLFWGVNKSSRLLAEDIWNNHLGKEDTIIFIDVDKDCGNDCHKKSTISSITNSITLNDSEMAFLDKIDALVDHCYNGPASVDVSSNDDVFGQLGLGRIRNILLKNKNIYIYLLSDEEDQNISGALNLRNDRYLKKLMTDSSPRFFVHAHRDSYNEVYAHYSQYADDNMSMNIKLVDSAFLSIQALKLNDDTLPVRCVRVNEQTGAVDAPFTSMIVGFGEIGWEAFKFLYEFSAFIDSKKNRTQFRCYAFDERMDKIEGLLKAKMPAITEEELCLVKTSVDSKQYWEYVENNINKLNYVVIALNDDITGMTVAVNLFKFALKERDAKLPTLKIMVRCYDAGNEKRMKEVEGRLNGSAKDLNVEIKLFATTKELFTYKNVVSNSILNDAKEFHYVYENSLLPTDKQNELTVDERWKQSFISVADKDGQEKSVIDIEMAKRNISRYHAICEINRKISQNFSNTLHCRTKMILMGLDKTCDPDRLNSFYKYVNSRATNTTEYNYDTPDVELLYNMAIVEHERWIAAHKLMGYTFGDNTDYVKKHHECMVDWRDLKDDQKRSYDCNVVDTTIRMAYEKIQNKKSIQ